MRLAVDEFRKAKGKPNEVVITDEDAKIIKDALTPYWDGKDFATRRGGMNTIAAQIQWKAEFTWEPIDATDELLAKAKKA